MLVLDLADCTKDVASWDHSLPGTLLLGVILLLIILILVLPYELTKKCIQIKSVVGNIC